MGSVGRRGIVWGCWLGGCLVAGCAHHVEKQPRLKIAILPEYSLHLVSQRYHPLLMYLEQQTGARVEWVSAATWESFPAVVERRRPHFAWQDGCLTALLEKTQAARPLLQVRSAAGFTSETGLVVVHAHSRLRGIGDLRGRRVAVPSRRALLSGLVQADRCAQQGLDPGRDLSLVVANRADRALLWVLQGKVDAAFVRSTALSLFPDAPARASLRVLAETEPFPGDFLVAFPHTPPALVEQVQNALLALQPEHPEHANLLGQAGIGGFAPLQQAPSPVVQLLLHRLRWPL